MKVMAGAAEGVSGLDARLVIGWWSLIVFVPGVAVML